MEIPFGDIIMLRASFVLVIASALPATQVAAQDQKDGKLSITITAGKDGLGEVPICVPLSLPLRFAKLKVATLTHRIRCPIGQISEPSLTTESIAATGKGKVRRDLTFITPALQAGATITFDLDLSSAADPIDKSFRWFHKDSEWDELRFGEIKSAEEKSQRPILRYMHSTYDDSTKASRDKSYKVFHHLYDPDGKHFITNGGQTDPYTDEKKLLYPHHRGLMFGFNRCTYGDGKKADTWHCPKEYVAHVKTLTEDAGPVFGRHRVLLDWVGPEKQTFAKEERELTVYDVSGGTLVEFASRLKTTGGKVILDGDPQHAGFQFRAANEVAEKTAKQTYFLRPDGKGGLGETRNWDPKTKNGPINLPWNAMSFVLGEQRYSALYMDHPKNPGERRWSERDYGRFGCYFEYELTEKNPLLVNYRVWLQKGEMTGEEANALSRAFASPPKNSQE